MVLFNIIPYLAVNFFVQVFDPPFTVLLQLIDVDEIDVLVKHRLEIYSTSLEKVYKRTDHWDQKVEHENF